MESRPIKGKKCSYIVKKKTPFTNESRPTKEKKLSWGERDGVREKLTRERKEIEKKRQDYGEAEREKERERARGEVEKLREKERVIEKRGPIKGKKMSLHSESTPFTNEKSSYQGKEIALGRHFSD